MEALPPPSSSSFEALPDSVAVSILSRLRDAKAVARCSVVCRRWRELCRCVEAVAFESFELLEGHKEASWLEAIISQMLLRSSGVRELSISYHPVVWPWVPGDHFTQDVVCSWLHHVSATLERLMLVDPNRSLVQAQKLLRLAACRRLRWLNLCYGVLTEVPPGLPRFHSLRTCLLDLVLVSDAALQSLVRLCPLLEHLRLNSCRGLRAPVVASASLLRLELVYEMDVCERSVSCLSLETPRLTAMSLSCVEELVADGEALLHLGVLGHVRPRFRDLSYLRHLHIKGQLWHLDSILHLVRLASNVKKLHLDAAIAVASKGPLQPSVLFHHLPSLTSAYIGGDMFECMQAGAAAAHNMSLPLLEELTVVVCHGNDACISLLRALLNCSASLCTLRINAQDLTKGPANETFFSQVLYLQRKFPHVKISLDCPNSLL